MFGGVCNLLLDKHPTSALGPHERKNHVLQNNKLLSITQNVIVIYGWVKYYLQSNVANPIYRQSHMLRQDKVVPVPN
jgi:hypothetical protein